MLNLDYSALRGRICERGLTQKELAARIGVSESQLNRKLAGEFSFKQDEIDRIIRLLDIDPQDICRYFFSAKS